MPSGGECLCLHLSDPRDRQKANRVGLQTDCVSSGHSVLHSPTLSFSVRPSFWWKCQGERKGHESSIIEQKRDRRSQGESFTCLCSYQWDRVTPTGRPTVSRQWLNLLSTCPVPAPPQPPIPWHGVNKTYVMGVRSKWTKLLNSNVFAS